MTNRAGVDAMQDSAIPSVDRAWELLERAYAHNDITVLGWADDGVTYIVQNRDGRVNFDVTPAPVRSHEDEVLVIAIVVPHPDEMTLDEVVRPNPNGPHRYTVDTILHGAEPYPCVICGRPRQAVLHDLGAMT